MSAIYLHVRVVIAQAPGDLAIAQRLELSELACDGEYEEVRLLACSHAGTHLVNPMQAIRPDVGISAPASYPSVHDLSP